MHSTVSCTQSIMNEWFCEGPKSISLAGPVKSHGMWWSHSPSPRNSLFHSLERRHRRQACSVFSAPVMRLASPMLGTGQIRIKQSLQRIQFDESDRNNRVLREKEAEGAVEAQRQELNSGWGLEYFQEEIRLKLRLEGWKEQSWGVGWGNLRDSTLFAS